MKTTKRTPAKKAKASLTHKKFAWAEVPDDVPSCQAPPKDECVFPECKCHAKAGLPIFDDAGWEDIETDFDQPSGEALRNDNGKARLDMIPARALFGLAKVYEHGAQKYEPNNWRAGTGWSRVFAALQRHALKWNSGETFDPASGSHHLLQVAFWAFALYEWSLDDRGTDDRYVTGPIDEPEEVEA